MISACKAIRALIETWSTRYRIDVDFEAGQYKAAGISSEIETSLYRVIQEALNNVAKHSGATRVALVLRRTEEQVQAIIEDDGRGFDALVPSQSGNGSGRLGLLGIRERLGMSAVTSRSNLLPSVVPHCFPHSNSQST
jgi:Signal transduction histidine kinase